METKILIITDDRDTKAQLVRSLTYRSMHALAIPTEPGALRSYLSQADLLVLDVPQADIVDFKLLKQIRQLSAVPAILLINVDDFRVSIRGLDHGADHVMSKPVNYRELRARIRALLRRARTSTEVPGPWVLDPLAIPEAQGSGLSR